MLATIVTLIERSATAVFVPNAERRCVSASPQKLHVRNRYYFAY